MKQSKNFSCFLSVAVLFLVITAPALAHRDRVEWPHSISITFSSGERATFVTSGNRIIAITVDVGELTTCSIPTNVCAKLREVRFETVKLLWSGSYETAEKADSFRLAFSTGPLRFGSHSEEPQVELLFQGNKFISAHGLLGP